MSPTGKSDHKKANPLEVLKNAVKSKQSFLLFVGNPKNWFFCACLILAIYSTFALITQVTVYHPGHIGRPTELCFFSVLGLWAGTISALFQVTIQESINRFRALNSRLQKDVELLSHEVDNLNATSDKFAEQLKQFADIKQQMQEYSATAGVEFDSLFSKTCGVFETMGRVQFEQERTLLLKIAADVEFMDNEEGMTFREFKRFCLRAPEQYRQKLKENQEELFKQVAGDDDIISYSEMRVFFDKLVKDCNPQTGEP